VFWFILAVATVNLGVGFCAAVYLKHRYDAWNDIVEMAPLEQPPAVAEAPLETTSPVDDAFVGENPINELAALIGGTGDQPDPPEIDAAGPPAAVGDEFDAEPDDPPPDLDEMSAAAALEAAVDASLESALDGLAVE